MLLHIIHPYTYLLEPDTERDCAAALLYSTSRENGHASLLSWHAPNNSPEYRATHEQLAAHPHFAQLLTAHHHISTPQTGRPLTRTEDIPDEHWRALSSQYTSIEDCLAITRKHKTHVLIGGYLDHCVTDAALFLRENHPHASIFIVPELSVPLSATEYTHAKKRLLKNKIPPIRAQDALSLAA